MKEQQTMNASKAAEASVSIFQLQNFSRANNGWQNYMLGVVHELQHWRSNRTGNANQFAA